MVRLAASRVRANAWQRMSVLAADRFNKVDVASHTFMPRSGFRFDVHTGVVKACCKTQPTTNGLPIEIGTEYLYSRERLIASRPGDALEHWKRFDRIALAGAQGVFGSCAFSAGARRHNLQIQSMIEYRTTGKGLEAAVSRRQERSGSCQWRDLPNGKATRVECCGTLKKTR